MGNIFPSSPLKPYSDRSIPPLTRIDELENRLDLQNERIQLRASELEQKLQRKETLTPERIDILRQVANEVDRSSAKLIQDYRTVVGDPSIVSSTSDLDSKAKNADNCETRILDLPYDILYPGKQEQRVKRMVVATPLNRDQCLKSKNDSFRKQRLKTMGVSLLVVVLVAGLSYTAYRLYQSQKRMSSKSRRLN